MSEVSQLKRREIVDALRIGAVPRRGLEHFAVGLDRYERALDEELEMVAAGNGRFKAVRGDYGTGKTFFSRWLEHRAREQGFATTLVQISETETPLYKMETVYRRAVEGLSTSEWSQGAFVSLIDRWFYNLEDEVIEAGKASPEDAEAFSKAVGELLEVRLGEVARAQPQFAAVLRACHAARSRGDHGTEQGLLSWLMGHPHVGTAIKRQANLKGDLDNDGALGFLRGLLELLRQTGRKGLVLVLDEVETIQRVRADSREKSLNGLRGLIDDTHGGRFPGLFVVITGTPSFFDGPQGVQRAQALAQRLHTKFDKEPRFDNPRAPQIRLLPFDLERMSEVGRRVRDLYPAQEPERVGARVTEDVIRGLADKVAGKLGGKVGIAPRIFLKQLVDLIDKVNEFADFDPVKHFDLELDANDLTAEERAAAGMERNVDDIALDLGGQGDGKA